MRVKAYTRTDGTISLELADHALVKYRDACSPRAFVYVRQSEVKGSDLPQNSR